MHVINEIACFLSLASLNHSCLVFLSLQHFYVWKREVIREISERKIKCNQGEVQGQWIDLPE